MKKLFLGIDLGTSGVKIGVIDEKKKVLFTVMETYPIYSKGLTSEQKPEEWWDAVVRAIKSIPQEIVSNIVSISFSGQMHGMVALDNVGNVLRPAILWNDTRTHEEVKEINTFFGYEKLAEMVGNRALEGFTGPKILWFKKNEKELFEKASMYLLPKDWLAYKFSGIFATDPSDASGTLYFNVYTKRWEEKVLDFIGITSSQLPKIFESHETVGTITKDIAVSLGLNENVGIVIGGGDNAVGGISMGFLEAGKCSISLGTSGVVYLSADKPIQIPGQSLHLFNSACENYIYLGVSLAAAGFIEWFVKDFQNDKDYTMLNINKIKENKIICLPYINGERTPINDPFASSAFVGLRRSNTQKDIVQSVFEAIAFSIYSMFEILRKNNIDINEVYITGGASQSALLSEMIATLVGKPLMKFEEGVGPWFGAATLAMGKVDGEKDFPELKTKVIMPNESMKEYLLAKYEKYQDLYKALKPLDLIK